MSNENQSKPKGLVINPQPKQALAWEKLLDNKTKYVVFGGAAGGGKSYLGCQWLLVMCIQYPGSRWFIARKELKRIMATVIPSFRKVCKDHGIDFAEVFKINGQYNYMEMTNGSRIDFLDVTLSPSDPLFEDLGSLEFTGGWIEEAGEVPSEAFEILKTRIGRHMSDVQMPKMLITCNPKKNWLYTMFYKPWKDNILPENSAFIQALYNDNSYTADVYGEQLAEIKDNATRQRLMYGEWEYEDDGSALLGFDEIMSIFTHKEQSIHEKGERFMTIDPAFLGKDNAVIMIWEGYTVKKVITIPKTDHSTLMQLIDLYAKQWDISRRNIVADAIGEGAYLPHMLPGIRAFIGGSSPLMDKDAKFDEMKRAFYANLRTQCIYEMAHKIKQGKVFFPSDNEDNKKKMIEELQQWKVQDMNDERKLKIIGKDEVKSSIGRSPDISDALYMRCFFDLDGERSGMTSEVARKQMQQNVQRPFNKWGI